VTETWKKYLRKEKLISLALVVSVHHSREHVPEESSSHYGERKQWKMTHRKELEQDIAPRMHPPVTYFLHPCPISHFTTSQTCHQIMTPLAGGMDQVVELLLRKHRP
jgi:hypothetical protein